MQELNQQEVDMVGGANLLTGLATGIVLGAQNVISTVGGAAFNFGVNLTDTAGGLLNGLVTDLGSIVSGTVGVLTGN
jgi:hypothetical protein